MPLTGFLDGFNQRTAEHRAEAERTAAGERDRSGKILSTLAGSDDPEVRNLAVTAMLSGAAEGKAGKGLSGFFGQVRQHPLFQALTQLVATPTAVDHDVVRPAMTPGLPGTTLPRPRAPGDLTTGPETPAAAPAVGAPPPSPLGVRTPHSSYRTYEPRKLFLSDEEKAAGVARGTMSGRLSGAYGAYETLTGTKPDKEFVESTTRGALGAPRRVQTDKTGTLELQDGTTVAGYFDQETDRYYDANGQQRGDVKGFIPGNPNAGQGQGHYVTGADGVVRLIQGTTATEVNGGQPIGKPQQPPSLFNGLVQTPGGLYGVTRSGASQPIGGVPVGTDPQVYASQLQQLIQQVRQNANGRVAKFGNFTDPEAMRLALEEEAKTAGYPSWAALNQAHAEAVARVGGTVPPGAGGPAVGAPPPGSLPPKSAGRGQTPAAKANDPDGLRKFIGGGRGGG